MPLARKVGYECLNISEVSKLLSEREMEMLREVWLLFPPYTGSDLPLCLPKNLFSAAEQSWLSLITIVNSFVEKERQSKMLTNTGLIFISHGMWCC